jgi:hypothetical protein
VLVSLLLASFLPSWSQELSSQPQPALKICVAIVANRSTTSLLVERMTARLTKSLSDNKLTAVVMDSDTTKDHELRPTLENAQEMKSKECDYVVLTRVTDPKNNPTEPRLPSISIGSRVPSVDASDPMGGQSGPVYRDSVELDFALFRAGNPTARLNTNLMDRPSANVSDSLMQAMDREANRVTHELKKK